MPKRVSSLTTDLIPDDKNANKGTPRGRALIEDSLRKLGAGRSVLTDRNGKLIAGNKTSEVAVGELGMDTIVVETDGTKLVVVRRTDLDLDRDASARALAFADNRAGELSLDWDAEVIEETIADGRIDLTEFGFSQVELDEILAGLGDDDGGGGRPSDALDPDAIPEVPDEALVRPGDLWRLGPHLLYCGDARDPDSYARLLGGDRVAVACTSPPYADRRKYDQSSPFRPVPPEEYQEWFRPVQDAVAGALADDGSYFLNIKPHCEGSERLLYVLELVLAHRNAWGWKFVDEFCWTRNAVPGGWPNRFKNAWEPVYHFTRQADIKFRPENVLVESDEVFTYSPENPKSKTGFYSNNGKGKPGMARPSNVLKVGAETGLTEVHSAPYPVGLPEFFIRAFSDVRDLVLDPFSGAGTTIVAAARTGRHGRGIEISPRYCDVTLDRYTTLTDDDPVRHDGVPWSQLTRQR
jgi:site-specific DNA-methyltransferase (adenine-specific)